MPTATRTAWETLRYCPQCATNYELCKRYLPSVPSTHAHKPVILRARSSKAPVDFWKAIVSRNDKDRTCNTCGDFFSSRVDLHVHCASCQDCNFCGDCLIARKADFGGHRCDSQQVWEYSHFEDVDQAYYDQQMRLAAKERLRLRQEGQKSSWKSNASQQAGGSPSVLRRRTPSQEGDMPEEWASQSDADDCKMRHSPPRLFAASMWDVCF